MNVTNIQDTDAKKFRNEFSASTVSVYTLFIVEDCMRSYAPAGSSEASVKHSMYMVQTALTVASPVRSFGFVKILRLCKDPSAK